MKTINNPAWFNANTGLLILRIGIGLTFLLHGIAKFAGMYATNGTLVFFAMLGIPAFFAWVVAIIETLGGIAVLLGVWTRISSYLLAIIMIGAFIAIKWKTPFLGGYELEFVLLAANLTLAAVGPGRYSVKKGELA